MTYWPITSYREIVIVNITSEHTPGELDTPITLHAHAINANRWYYLDRRDMQQHRTPPFPTDIDTLVVFMDVTAGIMAFHELGWKAPATLLDINIEARRRTNGIIHPDGIGMDGILAACGFDRECEPSPSKDYVQNMVEVFFRLLPIDDLQLQQALLHSQYCLATAKSEILGIPVNRKAWRAIKSNWRKIKRAIRQQHREIADLFHDGELNKYAVYEYAINHGVRWPIGFDRKPVFNQDTLKDLARAYPAMKPVYQIVWSLNQMRSTRLAIGDDSRNRTRLLPFRSITSRTQFSTAESIMGYPKVFRHLLQPRKGYSLAYIDYRSQEIGIAAALSGDSAMIAAYLVGDFYIEFAKMSGAVPVDATKISHSIERARYKLAALGIGYGMGVGTLASYINVPPAYARKVMHQYQETFSKYKVWSDETVNTALLNKFMETRFGWQVCVTPKMSVESVRNWKLQAYGSEMIRLAHMLAMERGVSVLIPVHDALLVEGPTDDIADIIATTKSAMEDASRMVLEGFSVEASTDWQVDAPDHYTDNTGKELWSIFNSAQKEKIT